MSGTVERGESTVERWARLHSILHPPCSILLPLLSSILCFFLVSCASTDDGGKRPESAKVPTEVSSIDFYGTELKFGWNFSNPFDHEIRLLSYVWELHVNGRRVDRSQSRQVRRIAPHSTYTLELPSAVRRANLEKTLKVNPLPSELPYKLIGRVYVGAGMRTWAFDLEDEGVLKLLAPLSFDIPHFQIKSMDRERARIDFEIAVHNPNTFPTRLSHFTADLILSGQTIAQGKEAPEQEIAPNDSVLIPLSLDLNFKHLGQVVARALEQDESAYTLYGKTEMSTPWGVKKVNYDRSGNLKIER